jgi:hypothetical protein
MNWLIFQNALLGKFGQDNSTKKQTVTVTTQKELNDLFWREDTEICDFISMSEYVTEVSIQSKTGFNRPNLKGNSIIVSTIDK